MTTGGPGLATRTGEHARYPCVCLPILGRARLLEQFNAGRIERHGETTGIRLGIGAVGVKAHRRAAGDRPLDELDATRVVLRRLPDLDFECTKAVFQALFDFPLDVSGRGRLLAFPMRTRSAHGLWSDAGPPKFRRDPCARDVALDPGRASPPRMAVPHMLPSSIGIAALCTTAKLIV